MNYSIHQNSIVETKKVGAGTRIWAFVHILKGAAIGSECNICDHVFIENDVIIGNRVTIKSGVQLWDGVRIDDDVFIGPNVSFTNDMFPRSKQYPEIFLQTHICQGASVGANSTILPGITIGRNAMIGAGSVVTKNVPPNAIAVGNPAYISGYVSNISSKHPSKLEIRQNNNSDTISTDIAGVTLHILPFITDMRGSLSFAELGHTLPFIPKRYFIVFDVSNKEIRGEHAHRTLQQFLVCVKGTCSVVVDNGFNNQEILLDKPNIGLYLPPMIWSIQYKYSKDAVLLVLASDIYDPNDYIRNYDNYLNEKG